ncbi:MAG: hypothetical protein GY944_19015, partial [bacterium]|nr:hypothetical protein [bacterium]
MKWILRTLGVLLILVAVVGVWKRQSVVQLYRTAHLFDEDQIAYNFQHIDQLFPTQTIAGGGEVIEFERGHYTLPKQFKYKGKTFDTEQYLVDTVTTGLLILH